MSLNFLISLSISKYISKIVKCLIIEHHMVILLTHSKTGTLANSEIKCRIETSICPTGNVISLSKYGMSGCNENCFIELGRA